jgi:hypothetical protein
MRDQVPMDQLMITQPAGFEMPFWYSSLQSFWLFYPVRRDIAESQLPDLPDGHGLRLAEFKDLPDQALVSLDFQSYTSGGSNYLGFTHEVEFNVYAYPESRLPAVPYLTVSDYVLGRDQTKTIGGFRLEVPCDNPNAIKAGKGNFGEPKWPATFDYDTPSLNSTNRSRWSYSVYQPQPVGSVPPYPVEQLIYSIDCRLTDLPSQPSNLSPLIEYGTRMRGDRELLVANFWTFFGPFDTYLFTERDVDRTTLTLGGAYDRNGLRAKVELLIGSTPPVAAQTFTSAPVSSESQAWLEWPDD